MENPCTNCIQGLVHPTMELCPVCKGSAVLIEDSLEESTPVDEPVAVIGKKNGTKRS